MKREGILTCVVCGEEMGRVVGDVLHVSRKEVSLLSRVGQRVLEEVAV